MPASRTSTFLLLAGSLGAVSLLRLKPKKERLEGFASCRDWAASLSSSGSSDMERIRRTSVLLRMVVEQLIWPPM